MGRQGAADRSGMGVRRARRTGRRGVRLGRRVHAGRPAHGQHLAGRLSEREPAHRRLGADLAGARLPAQRLRRPRHDRQRLGMDDRLVLDQARGRRSQGLLRARRTRAAPGRRQLRPAPAGRPHPAQGAQGRLAPLRAELLPALPPGGAPCRGCRHLDQPCRLQMRRAKRSRRERRAGVRMGPITIRAAGHRAKRRRELPDERDAILAGPPRRTKRSERRARLPGLATGVRRDDAVDQHGRPA